MSQRNQAAGSAKAATMVLAKALRSQVSQSLGLSSRTERNIATTFPPELLWMICESVEDQHDLHALMLTCRAFFKFARPFLVSKNAQGQREALHWACVNGHVKTLNEMLEAEAHTNPFNLWVMNRKFSTPVKYLPWEKVLSTDRSALLKRVHEPGMEECYSDAIQNLRTPLHIAAAWHHVEVVQILIAAGARPLFRPKDRRAPREFRTGRYHFYDAIDWAITPNPLIPDIELPREADKVCKILRLLLANLPILRKDYLAYFCDRWLQGWWPGSHAEGIYVLEIIKTLIDMGADPFAVVSQPKRSFLKLDIVKQGISIMDSILYHASLEKPEILWLYQSLFEHGGGGNVKALSHVSFSTVNLGLAVSTRNTVLVDWLLEKGANPDIVIDDSRISPLHMLANKHTYSPGSRVDIATQLIQSGANINLRDTIDGLRPMDLCLTNEIWGLAGLLMMVDMAKRFADRNIFHEERAWSDPEWLKFIRLLIYDWLDDSFEKVVLQNGAVI